MLPTYLFDVGLAFLGCLSGRSWVRVVVVDVSEGVEGESGRVRAIDPIEPVHPVAAAPREGARARAARRLPSGGAAGTSAAPVTAAVGCRSETEESAAVQTE